MSLIDMGIGFLIGEDEGRRQAEQNSKGKYACPYCAETFRNKSQAKRHIRQELKEK